MKLKIRKQIIFNIHFDHSINAYPRENEKKREMLILKK